MDNLNDDLIIIKSGELGDRTAMPVLQVGEIGYRTDTEELYIGPRTRLCGAKDAEEINTRISVIEKLIGEITARLDALEAPDE